MKEQLEQIEQVVDRFYEIRDLTDFETRVKESGNGTYHIRVNVKKKSQTGKFIGRDGLVIKNLTDYIEQLHKCRVDIRVKHATS